MLTYRTLPRSEHRGRCGYGGATTDPNHTWRCLKGAVVEITSYEEMRQILTPHERLHCRRLCTQHRKIIEKRMAA